MPGICGVVQGGRDAAMLAGQLERMLGRMLRHDWYRAQRFVDADGAAALVRVSLGDPLDASNLATSADGRRVCAVDGEVLGLSDGAAQEGFLEHCGQPSESAWLLDQHGLFSSAVWDGRDGCLRLVTDRFGMKPLYFSRTGAQFVFGSQLEALCAHPSLSRAHDLRGLVDFFSYGQLLGSRTLLEGVSIVPPGSVLEYWAADGRLEVRPYWRLASAANLPGGSHRDRIVEAFKAAVDRRLTDGLSTGVSLSGGLDARTVLGAVDERKHPVTTVTVGMPGSIDVKAAEQMAAITRSRHCAISLDAGFLGQYEQHFTREVSLTDGQFLSAAITLPALPRYRELGVQVLLRGHAGELLHMSKAYNFSMDEEAFAIRSEEALRAWLARRLCGWMVDGVPGPLLKGCAREEFDRLAAASLDESLAEVREVEPLLHKIWALFVTQRLRRETALSMREYDSLLRVRLPYLDAGLVDAVLASPPELKRGDALQGAILARYRPEFLRVVNANTGTRIGAPLWQQRLSKFRLRVLAKLGVPGYQPYERLGLWLRRELRPYVERTLLDPRCLDRGIFEPDTVRQALSAHFEERANNTYVLLGMLTVEVGQRLLFGETPAAA